jgi:hypothetical protein
MSGTQYYRADASWRSTWQKASGMKDLAPAAEIISTQFKPVPTKP